MRAIGAQKTFVRSMILWETLLISGVFGDWNNSRQFDFISFKYYRN